MCSTAPSLLSMGSPALRAAAVASEGAGHGGRLSAPTVVVAGALFALAASASAWRRGPFLMMTTTTTIRTATTRTANAAQNDRPPTFRTPMDILRSRPACGIMPAMFHIWRSTHHAQHRDATGPDEADEQYRGEDKEGDV